MILHILLIVMYTCTLKQAKFCTLGTRSDNSSEHVEFRSTGNWFQRTVGNWGVFAVYSLGSFNVWFGRCNHSFGSKSSYTCRQCNVDFR